MDEKIPQSKTEIADSDIKVGGNFQQAASIYNNTYIQGQIVADSPFLTNNIPTNADHILGRAVELAAINTHLSQNKPTVLVNGIGGIGKTSVATKYVATYGHQYKHLAWLTVQSSVAEAFTNDIVLLTSLHIEQEVRQLIETQRLTDAFKLVVHKLNTLDKTLVVLDNANNSDDLITHKNLFDTAKCHYLITSRTQPQEWTIVEIDHLPEEEAVALFKKLATSVLATDEDLKNLLSKLFYHTLLIELVAKAVENAGFSFEELQTMIERKFIHDENLNEDIIFTGEHGNNYDKKRAKIEEYIWLIFSNVKDLGENAKQILRGMALLPVATPFDRAFLKEHLALFEVNEIIPNLSLLVEWGWLQKEGKGFKIHPLVADVVVEHLRVDISFGEKLVIKIAELIKYDNSSPSDSLSKKNQYIPFAERLAQLFFSSENESVCDLLNCLTWYNQWFSFYDKAIYYGKQSLKLAKNIQNPIYNIISTTQSVLALVYQDLGNNKEAANLLEKALNADIKMFGTEHITVADAQTNLANAYRNLGYYKDAFNLFLKAIEIYKKEFDFEHPKVILAFSRTASIYQALDIHNKAVDILEKTLKQNILMFGLEHTNVASEQIMLGISYLALKRFDEAIDKLKLALTFYEKRFGQNHLQTAKAQILLATAYYDLGYKTESYNFWLKAFNTRVSIYGENHEFTVNTKNMFDF